MTSNPSQELSHAAQALAFYPDCAGATLEPLVGGLINRSFAVHAPSGEFVLQRVHPLFAPEIHSNIRVVTETLIRVGIGTPCLVPTREQENFVDIPACGRWRLMTRVPGLSFSTVATPTQAYAAGAFVAQFHGALTNLSSPLQPLGFTVHDPQQHLASLRNTLQTHSAHRLHPPVLDLAKKIFAAATSWQNFDALPRRVVHGDLKFNNFVFHGSVSPLCERIAALVDLDTLSELPLWMELGDAWRSWCNPQGEDTLATQFDLALFRASAQGYLENLSFKISQEECISLAHGVDRMSLELATRFAIDALQENYFGWDPARFATRGEHNLLRAMGQWNLHEQARACREDRLQFLLATCESRPAR